MVIYGQPVGGQGNVRQAENADTLDGKHAEEFALASDVDDLQTKVGDKSVSEQINEGIVNAGVLTIDTTDAEAGTANLINADTVGGLAADSFVLETEFNDFVDTEFNDFVDTVTNDYALKSDYVKKSGDTMSGNLYIRNSSSFYSSISFGSEKQAANNNACAIEANINEDNRRFYFIHYHQDMDGASTRYKDIYYLPKATAGLTGNKSYNIITTKDLSAIYPVGSIYMSVNSTSPASLFGGTWEQLKDRFLLGAGSTYSNGGTGGAATVTLTTSQIPSHTHKLALASSNNSDGYSTYQLAIGRKANTSNEDEVIYSYDRPMVATGGGSSHNNMPPYLVVYMWKRTA